MVGWGGRCVVGWMAGWMGERLMVGGLKGEGG